MSLSENGAHTRAEVVEVAEVFDVASSTILCSAQREPATPTG